jgi:hypothetical protein
VASHREEHENAFECLVGHAFRAVTYMGAWRSVPSEPGAYVEWVELTTVRGRHRFRLTTELDFGEYGVMVLDGAVDRGDALKIFDATDQSPWNRVIDRPLESVQVLWRPLLYSPAAMRGERPEFPRDVVLRFEDGPLVVLSAAGRVGDGEIVLGVDSVLALSEEEASGLGLLEGTARE